MAEGGPIEPPPEEMLELFRAARADLLSPAEVQGVLARTLAAPPPPPTAAAPPSAAAPPGALLGAGAAIAVVVAVGTWVWMSASPAPPSAGADAAVPVVISPIDAGAVPDAVRPPSRVLEHELLADARRAVHADPARALALTEAHRSQFPDGVLAPEREMLAVEALVALGHRDAARTRAAELGTRWPGSPYAARARAMTE